jgi:hypothetical protein
MLFIWMYTILIKCIGLMGLSPTQTDKGKRLKSCTWSDPNESKRTQNMSKRVKSLEMPLWSLFTSRCWFVKLCRFKRKGTSQCQSQSNSYPKFYKRNMRMVLNCSSKNSPAQNATNQQPNSSTRMLSAAPHIRRILSHRIIRTLQTQRMSLAR